MSRFYIEDAGRRTGDFMYVFKPIIDFAGRIKRDEVESFKYLDAPVIVWDELQRENPNCVGVQDVLTELDLAYLDEFCKKRTLILWGGGTGANVFRTEYPKVNFKYIIDSNAQDKGDGLYKEPEQLNHEDKHKIFIIVTSWDYYDEIKDTLVEMGFCEGIHFMSFKCLLPAPSKLMNKMLNTESITGFRCDDGVHNLHVGQDGRMCACAHLLEMDTWGNIFFQDIKAYEHSVKTRIFIRSCLNGTFCFCSKERCYYFTEFNQDVSIDPDDIASEKSEEPNIIWADLYFDKSCNLRCESCRNEIIVDTTMKTKEITDHFIRKILPNIQFLQAAGMGEIFFSPNYRRILEDSHFAKLQGVMFISNGNIRNLDLWDKYISAVNGNAFVSISLDATTEGNYNTLRRGGNFDAVMNTLNRLSELKRKSLLKDFGISMVVQEKNYHQIVELYQLGEELGAGVVNYNHLVNMGSYTDKEWAEICLYDAQGKVVPKLERIASGIKDKENIYFFRNCRLYVYKLLGKPVIDGFFAIERLTES